MFDRLLLFVFRVVLDAITELKEIIMTAQTEQADLLNAQAEKLEALTTQVGKVTVEVKALKDAFDNTAPGSVDPVLAAAISRVVSATAGVQTAVQSADDVIPDAPAEEPAP